MKSKITAICLISAALCISCVPINDVVVTTGTVLGIKVSQNPATQLYQAELGFSRAEFGLIPRAGGTNSVIVPDVMMEMRYDNLFTGGGLYQRLCVGTVAVQQPGASMMFAKDGKGNLSISNLNAVLPLLQGVHAPVTQPH